VINKLPHNTPPKQAERINDAIKNPNSTTFKIQTGKSTIELVKKGKL